MAQRLKKAASLTTEEKTTRRARALLRFRAVVRLVIANMYWLGDSDESKIGDNVLKNIQILTRKKVRKSSLTIGEKSILCKPKEDRTEEEKQLLSKVIGGMKCFRRYPPNVKSQLAAVTYFVYYGPGRQIVKQDHAPSAMYFMLSGEASVTVRHYDKFLKEWIEEDSGTLGPGTMFGEVALIHGIVRLATITTLTPCELLMIKKEDFDTVLKETVLKAWIEIQKIMNRFSYFKNWDSVTKRECSIMSRVKSFAVDETLLGDDAGLPSYVYFITKGTCCIIEHLMVWVCKEKGIEKYHLHHSRHEEETREEEDKVSQIFQKYLQDYTGSVYAESPGFGILDLEGLVESAHDLPVTEPTQHKIAAESVVPSNCRSEIHFIKICELTEGACFNIGEDFVRRRVVAITPTNCLLVPRYWIMKNNIDNIWNRVQQFLNKNIPTTKQIYNTFIQKQKFKRYRKRLIKDLLAEKRVANSNSIHNVPYSIRLKDGFDVNYS
ncbi:uncharacterized protein [Leptinotarsa decemlineata]|uniref:uncharacterized protein n=1 Tax=Leptinotarsa decemlineata TaxID=7539 RepID=UPI000C2532A0|nr:cyclic nucleotide-binding domain-containing protein 2-like [Leptinotarsa decemlineata]